MLFARTNVAVATCHASRCVTVSGGDLFYRAIIEALFTQGGATLGEVVCSAKKKVISENPYNDWLYGPAVLQTILGDPALRIITPVALPEEREELTSGAVLSIGANPFYGKTTVLLRGGDEAASEGVLFDISGRQMVSFPIARNRRVTFGADLRPGVYFLSVGNAREPENRRALRKKIVKLR